MGQKLTVFGNEWITQARSRQCDHSWAGNVIAAKNTDGSVYLRTLRRWFERFPLSSNKQKRGLKNRLESFTNEDHLGAVNELSWWEFMQRNGLKTNPVPATTTARPDFKAGIAPEFFCEVSTLNVSDNEKRMFEGGEAVSLYHAETLRRILLKATAEKQRQISYGADQKKPSVLVLFDYTPWSAFGTQFFRYLADSLFGGGIAGFRSLRIELSAVVYIERKVIEGRIALSRDRSAVYYNPNAKYALPVGTFPSLIQFCWQMGEISPKVVGPWIWLD